MNMKYEQEQDYCVFLKLKIILLRKRQTLHLLVNFSSISLYVLALHGQVLVGRQQEGYKGWLLEKMAEDSCMSGSQCQLTPGWTHYWPRQSEMEATLLW